jgi:histone deacetylase complex regulatory component SIN3
MVVMNLGLAHLPRKMVKQKRRKYKYQQLSYFIIFITSFISFKNCVFIYLQRKLSKPKLVRQANVSGKTDAACSSVHVPLKHLPLVESESFNSENTLPTPADEDQSYDQVRSSILYASFIKCLCSMCSAFN